MILKLTDEQRRIMDKFPEDSTDWSGIGDGVMLRIFENEKLREEINELRLKSVRGSGYYRATKLVGVETKFEMEQFVTDDETTDNHWNVSWLVVTLQELWSKPIIQKILRESFRSKK